MTFKINPHEKIGVTILILIIFIVPIIFAQKGLFIQFNGKTAEIGDTIGGITAPFTSIIGSLLVYFALKAQIEANKLIQNQIKKQEIDEVYRKQFDIFNGRVNLLREEINNFYYSYFSVNPLDPKKYNYKGSQAIYNLLKQNKNLSHPGKHHLNMYEIEPKLLELKYLLYYLEQLIHSISLVKFNETESEDNDAKVNLYNTIYYYFSSKIENNFKPFENYSANGGKCKDCGMIHGLPKELFEIVERINNTLRVPLSLTNIK